MKRFKKNSESNTLSISDKVDPDEQKLTWVYTLSNSVLKEHLSSIYDQFDNYALFRSPSYKENCKLILLTLISKLGTVDRLSLDHDTAINYYEILNVKLPYIVATLRTELLDEQKRWLAGDAFQDSILKMMKNVDRFPQVLTSTTRSTIKQVVERKENLNNPAAEKELARVKELAVQANEQALTVEDRFLVEQAVTSYLPDAVKLFLTFKTANEMVQKEALTLFIQQLQLISRQLEAVIQRGEQNSLKQMRAHLEFLQDKHSHLSVNED